MNLVSQDPDGAGPSAHRLGEIVPHEAQGIAQAVGPMSNTYLRAPPTSEIERAAAVTNGANRSSVSSGV
ncbi:hypothetical protein BLJAPNOD_04948 [Ensifer sp. M14]|jgi:hypothetical protein|nr:hypothetical protein BLJAPNOD_04948 [Ensifer sp. M14]